LLGLAILSTSIVTGYLVSILPDRWRAGTALALITASLLLAIPVLYPQLQYRYAVFDQDPTVDDAVTFSMQENVPGLTAFNEFLPIWRHLPFTEEEAQQTFDSLFASLPAGSRITHEARGTNWASATIDSPSAGDADLHILYFPGWTGLLDGEDHALKPVEGTGYLRLEDIPAGRHTLELHYEGTSAQRAGAWISAVTALGLILAAVLWRGGRDSSSLIASYPTPSWWLILGLVLLVAVKVSFIDSHTTLFRRTSTCSDVESAGADVDVRFDNGVRLCALELQARVLKPGDTVRITLYWQAERPVQEPADSFVHLWGTNFNPKTGNPLWGQQDKQLPGYHPVTRWNPGKLYRDSYEFPIDPDAPPGEYQIEIGWVQPATGQRHGLELVQSPDKISVSHLDSLLISGIELH
jgi:hypothetical protein